jgi:hypothetical protein
VLQAQHLLFTSSIMTKEKKMVTLCYKHRLRPSLTSSIITKEKKMVSLCYKHSTFSLQVVLWQKKKNGNIVLQAQHLLLTSSIMTKGKKMVTLCYKHRLRPSLTSSMTKEKKW